MSPRPLPDNTQAGFESRISAGERPQTYVINRVATGTSPASHTLRDITQKFLWAQQKRAGWVRLDGMGVRIFQIARTLQNLVGSLPCSEHSAPCSYHEPDHRSTSPRPPILTVPPLSYCLPSYVLSLPSGPLFSSGFSTKNRIWVCLRPFVPHAQPTSALLMLVLL